VATMKVDIARRHSTISGKVAESSTSFSKQLKNVLTIAKLTIEQEIRRQLLYAIFFFAFIYIFLIATLNFFGLSFQERIYFDFGLTGLGWFLVLLSITLSLNSISQEIENKSLYTILSRPITRTQYALGKFLGVSFFLFLAWVIFTLEIIVVYLWMKHEVTWTTIGLSPLIIGATGLQLIKSMIISLVVFIFSLYVKGPVNFSLTLLFFTISELSMAYMKVMEENIGKIAKLFWVIKIALPYFDFFNINQAVVFREKVTWWYILGASIYGLVYILFGFNLLAYLLELRDI